MRASIRLHILPIFALIAILFVSAYGYRVSLDASSNLLSDLDGDNLLPRAKREIENLEAEDYPSATGLEEQQEETGFWDKVVKVALKLFSRFIEWLNSS